MDELFSNRILTTQPSFIREILKAAEQKNVISFAGGLPNPISFPARALQESVNRVMANAGNKLFQYSTTQGLLPLREWIAHRYEKRFRWKVSAEDILITSGSQQGLDLMGKILLNKGDGAIIEKPGYLGAIQAFSLYEPRFIPIELKEDGLNIEELKDAMQNDRDSGIKLIYTVPNFQNPSGITYSGKNREAVCALLQDKNCVLIEDDPYGELRFEGEELPYIGAGRLKNSVVFGTFSKTVTPGMRIGYICTQNEALRQHLITAKQASDLHTNIFSQYIIHDYLTHNDYEAHIEAIKELYREQSNAMIQAIETYFPKEITYTRPQGGMFLWAALEKGKSAMAYLPKAAGENVVYVPGDSFYCDCSQVNTLRLNYTNSDKTAIREGIKRLGAVFAG